MTHFVVIQKKIKAFCHLAASSSSSSSDSSQSHLGHFIIIYPISSIALFCSCLVCFASLDGIHLEGDDLTVAVALFIILAVFCWVWFYTSIKVFPAVFQDVLWRMCPVLHYSFQDFTESIRDSIESYDYWGT